MENKMGNILSKLIGTGFILIAIWFTASQLGYLKGFNYMKIILAILCASVAVVGLYYKKYILLTYCGAGCYYFAQASVNLPKLLIWELVVIATLVAIGMSMIFGKYSGSKKGIGTEKSTNGNARVVFNQAEKHIGSKNLTTMHLSCICGEAKVHYEDVSLLQQDGFLNVNIIFGEAKLLIPRNWEVVMEVSTILGDSKVIGIEGKFDHIIHVSGRVAFGEITVQYV